MWRRLKADLRREKELARQGLDLLGKDVEAWYKARDVARERQVRDNLYQL